MTNREVIQLFAKYEPELILECFEDCYNIGKYDGYNDVDTAPLFWIAAWLTDEYDKNFFKEQDVERLIAKRQERLKEILPMVGKTFNGIDSIYNNSDILTKEQAHNFIKAIEACEKDKENN